MRQGDAPAPASDVVGLENYTGASPALRTFGVSEIADMREELKMYVCCGLLPSSHTRHTHTHGSHSLPLLSLTHRLVATLASKCD